MTKTLYLIDGSGFIFRAYHAMPALTDPKGTPVGAVYGFLNMVMKLVDNKGGQQAAPALSGASLREQEVSAGGNSIYIAVIFDAGRKTFRNEIYPEYKANRPPAPDDLIPQFPLVREATKALNLPSIELTDYEADDIIATYAKEAQKDGMDVVVVSSDKDLMQLVGEGVSMYDAMKQKPIGEAEVREKFGVGPDKVLDVLSLMGDSSDNVPGVPGIGPKTAAELINEYGDLETLLSRAEEIKQNKRRETILANKEKALLSKALIALRYDVPSLPPLAELALQARDDAKLLAFAKTHGFKSLALKLEKKTGLAAAPVEAKPTVSKTAPPAPATTQYTLVQDEKTLAAWVEKATQKGAVAFDTETTSLNTMRAELVGVSLACEPGEACYIPLSHKAEGAPDAAAPADLFSHADNAPILREGQIPQDKALALLKPLLEDESVLKIGHNIKYDMLIMQNYGIGVQPVEDTMLLSYVLHAGEHGQSMDELSERYLGHKPISFDEVTGTGRERKTFDRVELDAACAYAAEDADITLRLYHAFKPQVAELRLLALYETIERPLVSVLARMERTGIKVDREKLVALSHDFEKRLSVLEKTIHTLAGVEFNVGSPKQLGEVLFDNLGLEGGKKSAKTGAYSTGNDVLEDLAAEGHDIAEKVIEWRQLAKLKSTYSDTLPEQINPKTGRVHTSFAQAITSTGRLSSSDPNLQNIPIRSEEGKKIREAFVAEPGFQLISADYSQIELRLLAHIADIETLKTAFKNGDDIHAITASQMFGVAVDKVDADLRRSAKTINFGIIYGISAHGLAMRLSIGRGEAAAYIDQYFKQYPGIRDYMETTKEFAREHGYVETLFKRRCHVPGILDKNAARRQFFERAAINAPLQGTAADIIKKAMITVDGKLAPLGISARMLLQVHDELVFEVKDDTLAAVEPLIRQSMEQAAALSVPLTVDIGHGQQWNEAH